MADVRSMLRSELASRGQQSGGAASGKKRKANADDSQHENSRTKRSRNAAVETVAASEPEIQSRPKHIKRASQHIVLPPDLETVPEEAPLPPQQEDDAEDQPQKQPDTLSTPNDVDEAEWAAFERDVATPEPAPAPLNALTAAATIEAQPMTAEQLAAQAREQESVQRGKRDVEAEEEKEEAQKQLEDEFDEMEAFEERVKKLRERREQLRRGSDSQTKELPHKDLEPSHTSDPNTHSLSPKTDVVEKAEIGGDDNEDGSDSGSDEDEWDPWTR